MDTQKEQIIVSQASKCYNKGKETLLRDNKGDAVRKDRLLSEIKPLLKDAYGSRFQSAVLFGSEARAEGRSDSDVDILVLLTGPVHLWQDLQTALRALYPLSLRWGRPISPKPVDARLYESGVYPLYREAQKEGFQV
jgi:predicted nucleotidyltransferase